MSMFVFGMDDSDYNSELRGFFLPYTNNVCRPPSTCEAHILFSVKYYQFTSLPGILKSLFNVKKQCRVSVTSLLFVESHSYARLKRFD